ncbi:unnamed protein product [Alopecurus aequalis]
MLPAVLALRAELNGNYLQSVYVDKATGSRVEPSADTVVARARFVVEESKKQGTGFMHVRCCYNNKYWVPVLVQDSGSSCWVIGTADEPEKDPSSPSCTLFQALPVKDKENSIRFLHPGLKKIACVVSIGNKPYLQLQDHGDDQENSSSNFTVVGLPGHKELPKYVAFKGDNGKYLGTKDLRTRGQEISEYWKVTKGIHLYWVNPISMLIGAGTEIVASMLHHKFNQFHTEDIGNSSVIFTTFTNDDGSVRITSSEGGVWKRSWDNWILTEDVEDKNDRDALFEVVTGDDFVALRNLGNNKFVRRIPADGRRTSCLSACDETTSQWARLKMEEPLISRETSDVTFHLDEARTYNKTILSIDNTIRTNNTSRESKGTFSFTKKVEMVSKWETTFSSKIGVQEKCKFKTSGTPMISVSGEVAISTATTTSESQTTSESSTEETTLTQEYCIPPWTTVVGKFVVTRASCDVPYSYKQTNKLTNGKKVITSHDDGIYIVANNYGFHITVSEE